MRKTSENEEESKEKQFENDIKGFRRQVGEDREQIKLQNLKMCEIDEKLHEIDNEVNKAEKYERGLGGFFGFIPQFFSNVFTRKKKYKNKEIKEPEKDIKGSRIGTGSVPLSSQIINVDKVNNQKDVDDLWKEIAMMNDDVHQLRIEAEMSHDKSEDLREHIHYSNKRVERTNEKVAKKWKELKK